MKTTGPDTRRRIVGTKALNQEENPDVFYVLVKLPTPHPSEAQTDEETRGRHAPRFFVFTSGAMKRFLTDEDELFREHYRRVHGCEFTGLGVPSVSSAKIQDHESRWDKITARIVEE